MIRENKTKQKLLSNSARNEQVAEWEDANKNQGFFMIM